MLLTYFKTFLLIEMAYTGRLPGSTLRNYPAAAAPTAPSATSNGGAGSANGGALPCSRYTVKGGEVTTNRFELTKNKCYYVSYHGKERVYKYITYTSASIFLPYNIFYFESDDEGVVHIQDDGTMKVYEALLPRGGSRSKSRSRRSRRRRISRRRRARTRRV